MSDALTARIAELTDMGWELKSHTESTAALQTRAPFNWWAFLLWMLLLWGFGMLLYTLYYLLKPKSQLFLVDKDGEITTSGDLRYLQKQESQKEMVIRRNQAIKEQGFFKAMWPSILGMIFIFALWFFWIWLFIQIID
jgi:beta-lactamase regulating signal transducer with metallopeptidase domain